jgi:hypothetical protein
MTNVMFKGMEVLKQTTADKVCLPSVLIKEGMEEYSGWDYLDHVKWVRELTGLPIPFGSILAVNDDCSEVWLLSRDHYKTTCRLLLEDVDKGQPT